jgi:hypothetical protein
VAQRVAIGTGAEPAARAGDDEKLVRRPGGVRLDACGAWVDSRPRVGEQRRPISSVVWGDIVPGHGDVRRSSSPPIATLGITT